MPLLDFSDVSQGTCFPTHGWATNSAGEPILWLPIRWTVYQAHAIRERAAIADQNRASLKWARSLNATLLKLALSTSELEKVRRIRQSHPFRESSDLEIEAETRAIRISAIYLDVSFTYLRRLADQVIGAANPLLFRKHGSASTKFKDARQRVTESSVAALEPLVDAAELSRIFATLSGWYDQIRGSEAGIRDLLEHQPNVIIPVVSGGVWDFGDTMEASLDAWISENPETGELFTALQQVCEGFCAFLSGLQRLIGFGDRYEPFSAVSIGPVGTVPTLWPTLAVALSSTS